MRITIKLAILICFAVFFLLATDSLAEDALQICTFEYPLFMSKTPLPGRGYGFLIDSTNAALDAVGLTANYHFFPMKRSISLATKGEYDAFLGTIAHFPEEARNQFASIKMGELRFIFFYLKAENNTAITYDKLEDLTKYRIGTVRGSSSVATFRASGIEPDFALDLEMNFKKLFAKRIDLCVALELPAMHIIERLRPDQRSKITKIDKPMMSISVDFIVKMDGADSGSLYENVAKGLSHIKNKGIYQDIVDRYYGKNGS